ncbi:MAG: nucleoside hydrolase [Erysipelotrichaceae bacterium]
MKEKRKVILDCDTGSDDAIAIMMAILADELDVLGICTVAGNKALNFTTENTLAVLGALNSDVKVYSGCSESMVTRLLPSRRGNYSGFTGVIEEENQKPEITYHHDHLPLPLPERKAEKQNAVCWLVETLSDTREKITVVVTGPMTNLAMALRIQPEIAENIREIIFMGGGFKVFNATRCAEFNIWADPEAAQIVLTSGIKCTMVPLDATHKANFDYADCKRLKAMNNPVTDAVAEMIKQRIEAYDAYQPQVISGSAPIHDALALGYLLEPGVLKNIEFMRVDVDFSGGMADGQTICDTRTYPDDEKNCYVALDADNELFHQLVFSLLEKVN